MNSPIIPTELDKKIIDLRRRQAKSQPRVTQVDNDDFNRRLRISEPSTPKTPPKLPPKPPAKHHKLFNPDRDPIPIKRSRDSPSRIQDDLTPRRTLEPESMPERHPERPRETPGSPRQLFDHRKDDPVRFAVRSRPVLNGRPAPTSQSSGDHFSASSASSYAPSVASSSFTLSSTTDGSSTPSAIFDRKSNTGSDETNVFAVQLKKLYRTITNLEAKIKLEDDTEPDDNSRVLLKCKQTLDDELGWDKWRKQLDVHKSLVETIHNLLEISLAPSGPTSLRNIPVKYNMIVRLWTFGFHKLLESLRRASMTSPLAFEHLQDFIYYAYTFYTGLLEEPQLNTFKSGWLEALGDLARYRWAVEAVASHYTSGPALTLDAVRQAESVMSNPGLRVEPDSAAKSVSNAPAVPRIDDSPSPSVGIAAARMMDLEPEKETWRCIAREWYSAGLVEQPGTGKLHHHLGTLSRDTDGEELRAVYHFVKSLTTLHPFPTSREAILPIWSVELQAKRAQPDAHAADLFVLLHGMLFTNIQLDDFHPTLARFIERLEIEGAEEREWIMMAVVNICSILEYGKPNGVLKRLGGAGAVKVMAKKPEPTQNENRMQVDEDKNNFQTSPAPSDEMELPDHPPAFTLALQLSFSVLSYVLHNPTRKASQFSHTNLNPYLTILLTFLATILKHPASLEILERSIPWQELASFLATVPRNIMASQRLHVAGDIERWVMLTSNMAPPLPEDWCLRGMEWIGRKVYERGFWKSGEERKPELSVLDTFDRGELTDGRIEDDDDEEETSFEKSDIGRRWVRIVRSGVNIASTVDGLTWVPGTREWKVEGPLEKKVQLWKADDLERERREATRRTGCRMSADGMDVDENDTENMIDEDEDESEDDENDSEQIKELKERRRHLKDLLNTDQTPRPPASRLRKVRRQASPHHFLHVVPGYTVLVVDTNILLSMLSMFSNLVESLAWTVIVPLPVMMELEGLSSNTGQLGEAAQRAIAFIASHFRSHSTSLKVQTSKGNYLSSLGLTEQVDFGNGNQQRNMDDLILQAAIWQDEHWMDRSALLGAERDESPFNAVKVVLLSLDRNLRLKARARELPAASQKDLANLLSFKK